jgi:hypothetical protein
MPSLEMQNKFCAFCTVESHSQAGQDLFVISILQGKTNGYFLEIGAGHPVHSSNTFVLEKKFNFTGHSIDQVDECSIEKFEDEFKQWWQNFYQNCRDCSWPADTTCINELPYHMQRELYDMHGYDQNRPEYYTWPTKRPQTVFIQHNALNLDYGFLPSRVDYLQIDIDPPSDNLKILTEVLKHSRFSVITFEHDLWRNTEEVRYVRTQSRKLLESFGYTLLVNDVTIEPTKVGNNDNVKDQPMYFEDWYVDPKAIDAGIIAKYQNVDHMLRPKYYVEILAKCQNCQPLNN